MRRQGIPGFLKKPQVSNAHKLIPSQREWLMDSEKQVLMLKVMEKFRGLRNSEYIFSFPAAKKKILETVYT